MEGDPMESWLPATAPVTDACLRLGVDYDIAPAGLVPLIEGTRIMGPAFPCAIRGA